MSLGVIGWIIGGDFSCNFYLQLQKLPSMLYIGFYSLKKNKATAKKQKNSYKNIIF